MRLKKKHISNIIFVIVIALMFYPPTKVYFIRMLSFSPSFQEVVTEKVVYKGWQLEGLNVEDISSDVFEGKVVFLNFWATWCPPCIAEMPSMQKLYDDYNEKVIFLFVTNEDWNVG